MVSFPQPVSIGDSTKRWRLSDLRRYEAARSGVESSAPADEERFLSDKQVAERYGVARGTVWRWAAGDKAA